MNALIVIAQQDYQDHELEGTRNGLEAAGFRITLASKEVGQCTGKFGGTEEASVAMRDIDIADFNRIAFIGGPGAGALASDHEALKLANDAYRLDMPIGAICVAPTILAKAKILSGKRATVWESPENIETLQTYGATYTEEEVTVDGKIVTGNGPNAADEFGKTLAAL